MRGELVAIDLETTGLDPARDSIIEVGAVRLNGGELVAEYATLVNPEQPIPPFITHLTGIRNDDLVGKPTIEAVIPAIRAFAGSAPIIGHNVRFDTGFLQRYGILQNNLRLDTYTLASVLIPRAPRYNLNSLTAQLAIELDSAHRALGDARAAGLLYWYLWQRALALPYATLLEITEAARDIDWDARVVFDAALRERIGEGAEGGAAPLTRVFGAAPHDSKPLRPDEALETIDLETISELLGEDGRLARHMPGYEFREQQIEMASAVSDAFNQGRHMMIEAGTGTGKSIAYLVPSMIWSVLNNQRVVISTNTINLQDQLIGKDIPALRDALDLSFEAAVIKGRANYLCPRRLTVLRRRRPSNAEEMRMLAKILVWLLESGTGDRGEISLRGGVENSIWQRLSAEDEGCTMERCRALMQGVCPFYKARKAAEAAHILIVNHALLLSDAMTENRVLPDYRYLVLDEAHHLEDAATNGLSFQIDEMALRRRFTDLGDPKRGLLGELLVSTKDSIPAREYERLGQFVDRITDAVGAMGVHVGRFFDAIYRFAIEAGDARESEYSTQIRIVERHRGMPAFGRIAGAWGVLDEFMEVIAAAMRHLTDAIARMEMYDIPDYDDLVNSAGSAGRHLAEIRAQLQAFTLEPDANMIYWISLGQNVERVSVHSAPLHVGPLVEAYLWQAKESVVMTSATLQVNASFDYIRERLFAEEVETLSVGSPFDYRKAALVYIPNDMPEPGDRHRYQQAGERGLIELAAALEGRVMALFTSYAHLRQTAQAIAPRLALGNITVYDQSDGSSRQALLSGFKSTERAVLLGTRSFWEGVDIPGESLSALVIMRLPFAVPNDPIFAARSETYNNAFKEYAVPDAVLRFRQGFGRLIRTRTDRGIVVILDRRIVSKGYGANFLEALPDCEVRYGALDDLPQVATRWLAAEAL